MNKRENAKIYRQSICFDEGTYRIVKEIENKTGESFSEIVRSLLRKGLTQSWAEDNQNEIAKLIRNQMDITIKPHIERLAALSSKTGHMAATATFTNLQMLSKFVPNTRQDEITEIYNQAKVLAADYMKKPIKEKR